ncbi:bifunctional lysylphosphatidylglycerol synthetase/lysine--tRNA ligase LysX [Dermabacteraceae bacterium P7074]
MSGDASSSVTMRRRETWARVIVWTYTFAAVLSVFLLLFRHSYGPQQSLIEAVFTGLNVPLSPSLVSVALLTLLSGALLRRKRVALMFVAAFQLFGLIISAVIIFLVFQESSLPPLQAMQTDPEVFAEVVQNAVLILVAGLLLWLTWWVRSRFPARLSPGSLLLAAAVFVTGFVISVAVTHVLVMLNGGTAIFDWRILSNAVARAFGLVEGPAEDVAGVPRWILSVSGLLVGLTIFLTAYVFMRSSRRATQWTGDKEVALRALLAEYGQLDSLSYFATRRDKTLIFSPDGRAAIAYRVIGSVALASGDPVGPASAWPAAIAEFMNRARLYGWVPAVISSGEKSARAWADAGLQVFPMGDEAILHSSRFDLANTSMTQVRRAVNHARKAGMSVKIRRHSELSKDEMAALVRLADEWREGGPERGYSMALGRLADPSDGNCVLVSAHDDRGEMQGFLSFVPWGRTGASLDLMRRSPEAPNGVNEFMVATLLEDGPDHGITEVSLNFAMFRGIFEEAQRLGASPFTRFNSRLLGRLDRFFQLESLYRANQKYQPEWVPRYLCFDGSLSFVRVAFAAGIAEGFVPVPFLRAGNGGEQLSAVQLAEVEELSRRKIDLESLEPRRSDQSRHRVRHALALREAGMEPYPIGLAAPDSFAKVWEALRQPQRRGQRPRRFTLAGRVRYLRHHGGVSFVGLTYGGRTIQVVAERERLGADSLRLLQRLVDTGDLLQVQGQCGRSRSGERSLLARNWVMAAKALQPIPFTAFDDPESRLRRRSTDLIVHPREAGLLVARAKVVSAVRSFLAEEGYIEVETPMLNVVHGGASARPFRTHINAYGMDLTLRIAPELYLKRLLVGQLGPIFEIGRNFRNEGADATHNPEFTALEAYAPYAGYTVMRHLTERMIKAAATALYGSPLLPLSDVRDDSAAAKLTDVSGPWRTVSVCDAVSEAVGMPISLETDFEDLLCLARKHEIHVRDDMGPGALIEELYGELVEPKTIEPTFYTDFPLETSPLTGPHRSAPGLVERWDLVANGMEIGTAYSELADPLEQRRRLTEQSLKAAAGDPEAMEIDEDFLYALENGMPPAGGLGIGMDRLVMLLTDTNIREVLSFPFVKPAGR